MTKNSSICKRSLETIWMHLIMACSCFSTKSTSKSNNINLEPTLDTEIPESLDPFTKVEEEYLLVGQKEHLIKLPYIKKDQTGDWGLVSFGDQLEGAVQLLLCHLKEKSIIEIPPNPPVDGEGYLVVDSSIIIPSNFPKDWDIYTDQLNLCGSSFNKEFYIKKSTYIPHNELSYSLHILGDQGSQGINISYYFKRDFNRSIKYIYKNVYLAYQNSKQILLFLVKLEDDTQFKMFGIFLEDIQNSKKDHSVITEADCFSYITDLISCKPYHVIPDSLRITSLKDKTEKWCYICFDYQLVNEKKELGSVITGHFLINKEESRTFRLEKAPSIDEENRLLINKSDLIPFFLHTWGVTYKKASF